jgi:hypothetical protein
MLALSVDHLQMICFRFSTCSRWNIARCRYCGSQGTHLSCSNLTTTQSWACGACLSSLRRTLCKGLILFTVARSDFIKNVCRNLGMYLFRRFTLLCISSSSSGYLSLPFLMRLSYGKALVQTSFHLHPFIITKMFMLT